MKVNQGPDVGTYNPLS